MTKRKIGITFDSIFFVVVFALLACVIINLLIKFVLRIPIPYVHLISIPIIFAGIWYHKDALYVAYPLAITLIFAGYFATFTLSLNEFGETALFLVVACVIGMVSGKEPEKGSALQESEEKRSGIVDGFSIPTFVLNTEHKITRWNSALEALTGVKSEEMIGTDNQWKAFYPAKRPVMADLIISGASNEEFKEKYGDKYRASFIEGSYEALDFFPDLADGGKWLLFTAAPLRDSKGNSIGAIETLQDFTELKKAEKALAESEYHYRTLFENVPVAVALTDREGRIRAHNENFCLMTGYSRAELGQMLNEKIYANPEDHARVLKQLQEEGAVTNIEVQLKHKDGFPFPVIMNSILFSLSSTEFFLTTAQDITERKRAEEALKKSEERYRLLVETMNEGLAVQVEDGLLNYVNEKFSEMLGYSRSEMIGRMLYDFLDEENKRIVKAELAKRREGNIEPYELVWTGKDGREVYTILSPAPILDDEGSFKGSFAVISDITEQKLAEDALRESEEKFRTLAEDAPFGISVMNPYMSFEYFNPKFTELFGYTIEDLPDKESWFEKAYPNEEYRKRVISYWQKDFGEAVKHGEIMPRIFTVRCKDGRDKVTSIRSVVSKAGKHLLTYEDITIQAKAEEALRASEDRLKTILDAVQAGVVIIDAETHEITDANLCALDMICAPREEVLGSVCHHYICPAERGNCPITDNGLSVDNSERVLLNANGERVPVLKTVIPIFLGGRKHLLESFVDITDRKRAEKMQLRLLSELARANRDLKDFAYIVSHDLKAPLRGIGSLAEWLSTDYSDKLDETGQEHLDLLGNRVQRMQHLIDGILQYSKVGRLKEEKEEVNLNSLISEVVDLIDPPINIEIRVVNKLPTIYCERTKMEQVFQNLLSNAVRYMDKPDGKVTIDCAVEGEYLKFSVADNGPGIDKRHYERIFQIFQTLRPSEEAESTGVGLSIVKKIVEMNGGKIWVKSKVGEGSTFFFTVPQVTREGLGLD